MESYEGGQGKVSYEWGVSVGDKTINSDISPKRTRTYNIFTSYSREHRLRKKMNNNTDTLNKYDNTHTYQVRDNTTHHKVIHSPLNK